MISPPGGLDDRGAAAAEDLLVGSRRGKSSGNAERGMYCGTETTKPDSIAMWRIDASQPSVSSAVGRDPDLGPER